MEVFAKKSAFPVLAIWKSYLALTMRIVVLPVSIELLTTLVSVFTLTVFFPVVIEAFVRVISLTNSVPVFSVIFPLSDENGRISPCELAMAVSEAVFEESLVHAPISIDPMSEPFKLVIDKSSLMKSSVTQKQNASDSLNSAI